MSNKGEQVDIISHLLLHFGIGQGRKIKCVVGGDGRGGLLDVQCVQRQVCTSSN